VLLFTGARRAAFEERDRLLWVVELPLDHRVEAAHSTLVIGVTSRPNFPAMYR
jgi:hypothetical protein